MDITLTRVDYAQIGTASKGCMRVIAADKDDKKKKTRSLDKVVCGGHSGVVLCIARKNAETQVVFKTMPGPRIDCLRLGGALGTVQDKIFVACENYVKGYSKKGKQFFAFETNMAEPVSSMYIYGVDMFLCGRLSFNHYHDCADANYYLCNDRINDVLCLPVVEGSWVGRGITPVLACDDKTIKVLQGSELKYEVQLGDIPCVLHLFMNDGGFSKQRVLYGTKDGRIGLVDLPPTDGTLVWEIPTRSSSAITSIHCYAITGSGCPDIIVGKEDGLIEIYVVDFSDQASFKKSFQCEESIVSLQCGRVSSESFDEIVACTYTGWVFALSTEPIVKPRKDALTTLAPHLEVKVQQVRNELEELEQKVSEERQRYHQLTLQEGSAVAAVPRFAVQDHFTLDKSLACYMLSIELIVPIDYILLQSDVGVELLDVEKNSAVVSMTTPDEKSGNALLATYRCQANTTRIEMRIRSIEGQYGTVQVYICPKIHPKMCQVNVMPHVVLYYAKHVSEFEQLDLKHCFSTGHPHE
uniref:Ciliary BBSome complex subunit 2 middle region domain-containing protein n=1 Tax=Ascaris lumbricoides TaxID=6252 RepID=A0A9J2PPS3_ASCLU